MKINIEFSSIDTSTHQEHTFVGLGRITHSDDTTTYYLKEETLPKPTIYKIEFKNEDIVITRSGLFKSKLFLTKNQVISNNYPTEYGTINVDTKLGLMQTHEDGCLFEYELYQDMQCVAQFRITLKRI